MYESTISHHRMTQSIRKFEEKYTEKDVITISRAKKYQTIMGFGGAMTDATGINIVSLPKEAQDLLMQQYFGDNGIQYTIIRVPVGGSDFSTHPYTLDDTPNDSSFTNFKLAEEDYKYKIPLLKQAMNLSKTYPIKLMGAPWTAPPYMKDSKDYIGGGRLLDQYYPGYAEYLIKFLQAYKEEGLNFYIMSSQNEPVFGSAPGYDFNGMGFEPSSQAAFVGNHLGPSMEQNGLGNVKILIGDDQRPFMYRWVQIYLQNENASKYASGVGIHFYLDEEAPPEILTRIHELPGFENKFILYTEACQGSAGKFRGVRLGSWKFGTGYLSNIIDDLNNWSVGWVDWNMALDLEGGPNWAKNFVDSPIIVNASAKEFYKNPMYYALAHVSKFIVPGSVRIDMTNDSDFVKATAFETPNNQTVVVLLNTRDRETSISIKDEEKGYIANLKMEPESMITLVK
ncbi:lysosomal acid glucosylceramidase-like [Chrysoperla carnea]|uniref:lysosomal acid glucosylceramidase-like n=1 Tax=Chrysoperla carnea TaxID=189513 RepID=UPI001D067414|nr:lysosomal acid glucosylceramidase-like [Chrysoperla carnea]